MVSVEAAGEWRGWAELQQEQAKTTNKQSNQGFNTSTLLHPEWNNTIYTGLDE